MVDRRYNPFRIQGKRPDFPSEMSLQIRISLLQPLCYHPFPLLSNQQSPSDNFAAAHNHSFSANKRADSRDKMKLWKQTISVPLEDRKRFRKKWYAFSSIRMCNHKGCLRTFRAREDSGPVYTLCAEHQLKTATAASRMYNKWCQESCPGGITPQPSESSNADFTKDQGPRVVMQDVQQDGPPKTAEQIAQEVRQMRIQPFQEHQREMEEVAAAKERCKKQKEKRTRRQGHSSATAIRVDKSAPGSQNRIRYDIFNPI